ncbi:MAG: SOS response-associated peptidase [Holophagales bacterium]|nr:SOS response-associated peptidase [Holophagales bacterium]MBK9965767.1 SOS response-associated peptidase [Holophagales bacterium]
MCGRYVQTSPAQALATRLGARLPEGIAWTPRWNVAPGTRAPIVRDGVDGPALALLSWGLVPSWAKDAAGLRPINARAEGIGGKPMFRDALKRRRALVPADGFYEWKVEAGGKAPWFFRLAGGAPFVLAGLWERREAPGTEPFETFAIVTTEANELVRPVHARMPVLLDTEATALWRRPGPLHPGELERCLAPFDAAAMEAWPVSTWVNAASREGVRCVEPLR